MQPRSLTRFEYAQQQSYQHILLPYLSIYHIVYILVYIIVLSTYLIDYYQTAEFQSYRMKTINGRSNGRSDQFHAVIPGEMA